MRMSPDTVPGLDGVIPAADLDSLTGMRRESDVLDDLAKEVMADLNLESSLVDELAARVAAAVRTALGDGGVSPHRRAAPRGRPSVTQPWRDLDGEAHLRVAGRDDASVLARSFPPRTPAPPADGQICAVLAVDIAGFNRPERDDVIRRYLHEQLHTMVRMACDDSGVPSASCCYEDRGDGIFAVIPPTISVKGLIDPFPEKLRGLIRRHNHICCDAARIQLRAAVHIGPVDHDGYGFIGTDVNHLFRILEARPLKRQLTDSGAELTMAVSDYVYQNLIRRYPSLAYPDAFRAFRFQTKETRGKAWTYLPRSVHGGRVSD